MTNVPPVPERTPVTPVDVYLCGPMSGLPALNEQAFHAAAKTLRDHGYTVFNPAEHLDTREFCDAMRDDLAWLLATRRCLVALPGWETGVGSRLEVLTAIAVGLPAHRYDETAGIGGTLHPTTAGRDALQAMLSETAEGNGEPADEPHEEAARLVLGPRGEAYDHPLDNFTRTAHIWTGVLYSKLRDGTAVTPEDVALCMVGVKVAREAYRHKRDNITDAHGYLMTHQMVLSERARRNTDAAG